MQILESTKLYKSIIRSPNSIQSDSGLLCTPEDLRQKNLPGSFAFQSPLHVVDLFCGCGGLSFGTLLAGLKNKRAINFKLAIDFNTSALAVYRENLKPYSQSIRELDINSLVTLTSKTKDPTSKEKKSWVGLGAVDLIVAGPPCQGHSDLNNSSRRSDPRNLLYLAPARAAAVLKPKVVLIENVPTVTRSKEDVVGHSRSLLQRLGYSVAEFTINLTRLGVPQSRTRHVQIASLRPLNELIESLADLPECNIGCYDYINDIENEAEANGDAINKTTKLSQRNEERIKYLFDNNIFDLPNFMRPACHRDKEHSYISMYGRLIPHKPAQTITSGFGSMGQGRFVHPTKPRMITAHEAARLQGFPDSFSFGACSRVTNLREMIGNAVPPALAQIIVSLLIAQKHFD